MLGLTAEEFYALTPRQYHLLVATHRKRFEHYELLAGIIASAVANWSFHAPKESLKPRDFMPSRLASERPERNRLNRRAIAAQVRFALDNYQRHYEAAEAAKKVAKDGTAPPAVEESVHA